MRRFSGAAFPDRSLQFRRKMYAMRFGEPAPERRSIEQLRGIEGARVKRLYELPAQENGVAWRRRDYDPGNWSAADMPNLCLSSATSCLYGLAEAAILAAGYAPAIGFLHTGKPQSFVYDVANVYKFETVVPIASPPLWEVRPLCSPLANSISSGGLIGRPRSWLCACLRAGGGVCACKIMTRDPPQKSDAGHLDPRPLPVLGITGNPDFSRRSGYRAAFRHVPDIHFAREN